MKNLAQMPHQSTKKMTKTQMTAFCKDCYDYFGSTRIIKRRLNKTNIEKPREPKSVANDTFKAPRINTHKKTHAAVR